MVLNATSAPLKEYSVEEVAWAIHLSPPFQKRTTILTFSKSVVAPSRDEVTVDLRVLTAEGWTDVASIVIEREGVHTIMRFPKFYEFRFDENPVMTHLRTEASKAGAHFLRDQFFWQRSMEDVLDKTKKRHADLPWLQNVFVGLDKHVWHGGSITPPPPKIDGLEDMTRN
jgi:hypothetical protein